MGCTSAPASATGSTGCWMAGSAGAAGSGVAGSAALGTGALAGAASGVGLKWFQAR